MHNISFVYPLKKEREEEKKRRKRLILGIKWSSVGIIVDPVLVRTMV